MFSKVFHYYIKIIFQFSLHNIRICNKKYYHSLMKHIVIIHIWSLILVDSPFHLRESLMNRVVIPPSYTSPLYLVRSVNSVIQACLSKRSRNFFALVDSEKKSSYHISMALSSWGHLSRSLIKESLIKDCNSFNTFLFLSVC